jgi:small-conductance mechanosensitive channel
LFLADLREWLGAESVRQIFNTTILAFVVYGLRFVAIRRLAKMEFAAQEARRRAVVLVKNAFLFLALFGLFIIWATELRTLAISLFAITAAIVVATKELILCLSGGLYRTMMKGATIGDRIEIGNHRGDIIDQTLLTTTLLEVGPGQLTQQATGRAVVLPNALFLSTAMINESFTEEYIAHTFQIPLKIDEDWERAEQILMEACNAEVSEFLEEARNHMKELHERTALGGPSVEPRVIVKIPEAGKITLIARIAAPSRRKGRVEQAIIRRFLRGFYPKKEPVAKPAEPKA